MKTRTSSVCSHAEPRASTVRSPAEPRASTWTLALVGALSLGAVGCEQPTPKCNIASSLDYGGNFAARYTLVAGSKTGEGDCDAMLGEVVYFGTYYKRKSDDSPDYSNVSVGIQPSSTLPPIQNAANAGVEPLTDEKPYSYGKFDSSKPDGDDMCHVTQFDLQSAVRLPAAPEWEAPDGDADPTGELGLTITMPEAPAVDMVYEFSNVQVYMTPDSPGRQVSADLTYTKDGCSARYTMQAIFPATPCGVDVLDAEGMPTGEQVPDPTLCTDNPVFVDDAVECDPVLMMCVLTKPVPSLK